MRLIASTPDDYRALQGASDWNGFRIPDGGLEPPDVLDMLTSWSGRLNAAQGWGSWLAVEGGEVVASLAIKAPVAAGTVEIGYGVAPARRGRGVATRAVQALLAALAEKGVTQVLAETALDNPASGRVMEKTGFRRVGQRQDPEDGALILWARGT